MSAALFGANLLEEVHQESLEQLLSDLQHNLEPEPRCLTGVPELDRLLDLFRFPPRPTSAIPGETLASPRVVHDDQDLGDDPTYHVDAVGSSIPIPKPGIVEIRNSVSGTGKTNLLYHIVATSILPSSHGGKEATIVWLDIDISFSALRLHQVCINYLTTFDTSISQAAKQSIAHEALKHVHIFSIHSSKQLLSALNTLETYLLQSSTSITVPSTKHYSSHRPLSLIILDSATSFHWPDRFDAEISRLESIHTTTSTQPHPNLAPPTATQILTQIKRLQTTFGCVVLYTTNHHLTQPSRTPYVRPSNPATNINPQTPLRPQDDTQTLSPWTLAATLCLNLTRIPVPQFASHMSLEECVRDRAKRQEVVSKNRVRVGVDEEWLSAVVRDRGVKRALRAMEAKGAFVIRIGDKGVDIER